MFGDCCLLSQTVEKTDDMKKLITTSFAIFSFVVFDTTLTNLTHWQFKVQLQNNIIFIYIFSHFYWRCLIAGGLIQSSRAVSRFDQ